MSCRICQEPTENGATHCEYHALLNGGLTIATVTANQPGDDSDDSSVTPKNQKRMMDELLSGLGNRRERHYRDSSSRGSRSSANSSYAEKMDHTALLLADPTLDRVLIVPMAMHYFARFLVSESSEENIQFWEAVRRWNSTYDMAALPVDTLVSEAQEIIDNFIVETAPKQVNLSSPMVAQVRAALKFTDPELKLEAIRDAFSVCKNAVLKVMGDDGFRRFLKSSLWQEYCANSQEVRKGATQTVHMPNGDLYVGELRDERPSGHGVTTFHNGDKHTGKYKDGMMHGIGEYLTKTTRFVGEFHENMKHGEGVQYEIDTERSVHGNWVRDQLNGQGISIDGANSCDMVWKDGKAVCKLQRDEVRLLGNLTTEHGTGSKRVHCTIGINGLSYGFMKGSAGQEKGLLQWIYLNNLALDLVSSSLTLQFLKHGETTTVGMQCNPMTVTTRLIESVNFAAHITVARNSALVLVQSKALFARIGETVKRRKEFGERLQEVMNSITENEMAMKSLQDGVEGLDDQSEAQQLPALIQENQSLLAEQRQLEGYLDNAMLLVDYALLKDLHSKSWEEKKIDLDRPPSRSGRLSLSRIAFGRQKSSSSRNASPSPSPSQSPSHRDSSGHGATCSWNNSHSPTANPGDDSQQIDDLMTKTNALLEANKIARP